MRPPAFVPASERLGWPPQRLVPVRQQIAEDLLQAISVTVDQARLRGEFHVYFNAARLRVRSHEIGAFDGVSQLKGMRTEH